VSSVGPMSKLISDECYHPCDVSVYAVVENLPPAYPSREVLSARSSRVSTTLMERLAFRLLSATEVAAMFAYTTGHVHVQEGNQNRATSKIGSTKTSKSVKTADKPKFTEYRGIGIGMSADDTRRKLGNPKEKDKTQDLFVFSSRETAPVFYDNQQKFTPFR
jgi:hypothetical protein